MTASDLHQRMLHLLDRVKAMDAGHNGTSQAPVQAPARNETRAETPDFIPDITPEMPAASSGVDQASAAPAPDTDISASPEPEVAGHSDEDRSTSRHKVLKRGKIIYAGHNFEVDCQIRDLSETGAKLRLLGEVTVPSCFEFVILPEKITKISQVCWRNGRDLGIRFVDRD